MHRVEKLADRKEGFKPKGAPAFHSIIPLQEIIAETIKVGISSKAVNTVYQKLLHELGNEFSILMDTPFTDIEKAGSPLLSHAISQMRKGNVNIAPGFDGEFGKIKILSAS